MIVQKIRSCRDVACYLSTVQLPQNEQYQQWGSFFQSIPKNVRNNFTKA